MTAITTSEPIDEAAMVAAAESARSPILPPSGRKSPRSFSVRKPWSSRRCSPCSRRPCASRRRAGSRQDEARHDARLVLGLDAARVQFTPDLMPADILGSEVMDQDEAGRRSFRFIQGPIFTQLLMADEINRASPRTQSALLQAMQEYHVSVAGKRLDLPRPFHVLEHKPAGAGRHLSAARSPARPLPDAGRRALSGTRRASGRSCSKPPALPNAPPARVIDANRLAEIQGLIRKMPVGETVVDAILNLVRAARPGHGNEITDRNVSWGPGPRAGQALTCSPPAPARSTKALAPLRR